MNLVEINTRRSCLGKPVRSPFPVDIVHITNGCQHLHRLDTVSGGVSSVSSGIVIGGFLTFKEEELLLAVALLSRSLSKAEEHVFVVFVVAVAFVLFVRVFVHSVNSFRSKTKRGQTPHERAQEQTGARPWRETTR